MLPFGDDQLERTMSFSAAGTSLDGTLGIPPTATGVVLFAHGSGSSRFSPRNRLVARALRDAGLGTLLLDLLSRDEEVIDERTSEHRFDIALLAGRLLAAIDWLRDEAATLVAAAERPERIGAVVSRGGRPDLAGNALARVRAPTLLIVGGLDDVVIRLNEEARDAMRTDVRLQIVPGATHLFEEPGTLEQVAAAARAWFVDHLASDRRSSPRTLAS
jgi:putative phosphoribosyl transferase